MSKAEQEKPQTPKRRKSWLRRVMFGVIGTVAVLLIALVALAYVLSSQRINAPDWLRDRVEARADQLVNEVSLSFQGIDLVIGKGWRPRVAFRDLVLTAPDGRPVLQLADAEASLAMRPLLRGKLRPKRILLSSAFAKLRRDRDGNFALLLGDAASPLESAPSLAQLIEQVDRILTTSPFDALVQLKMDALTLRYEDARSGRVWTLDGGRLVMDRRGDQVRIGGNFSLLGGGDYATTVELNYSSLIGSNAAEFGAVVSDIAARDIAVQSIALNWLDVLRAPISGALRGSIGNDGAVGPMSATLHIAQGVLQPTDQVRPIPFDSMRSYFTYDPKDQVISFDELSVDSERGSGVAEGRAHLAGIEQGSLTEMVGQIRISNLRLNPEGVYEEPLELERASADFKLELAPFRLSVGEMYVTDRETRIRVSGGLTAHTAGWHLDVDGQIDALTPERLVGLWPDGVAARPREWVSDNLSGGVLYDIDFALRSQPGRPPDISAAFDFEDATVRFMRSMPPITGATGYASLHRDRFVTTALSGKIKADQGGAVDITGTSFIIPDVSIKKSAPGIVRAAGAGPVTAILSLLNRPPLEILKGTPLPVDMASGRAQITGTLSVPLKRNARFRDLEFHLKGQIDNVSSTVLVPGHRVAAAQVGIVADQGQVVLSADGAIDDLPVSVRWRQPLGEGVGKTSRAEGTFELSQKTVETFNIGLPPGTVSGQGQGRFTLDLAPQEPPALAVSSDLAGVSLRLAPLGWRSAASATGTFELAGALGDKPEFDRIYLRASGLEAEGAITVTEEGGLERASFSSLRMSDWLDARVVLIGRGTAPPEVRVAGGVLDMRRADFGDEGSGGGSSASGPMLIALDRLQITDTIALTGFAGRFSTTGGLDGPFRGKVNGGTEITGRVTPQGGRSAYRIRSDDAGGVFRSAGLLRRGRGGAMDLVLRPEAEPGYFDGTLRVRNTRIQDAPAIAALLNAVSVVGLLDELSGQGIQFVEVDARFQLNPTRLVLYSSSATGPSLGISMDGIYDLRTSRFEMQGVVSPVYLINSIGAILTRKGEGVFGFNYTLRGTAQDPVVQVNPLSALTPGMFREIFRGAPPKPPSDQTEDDREPRRSPRPSDDGSFGGR